MKSAFHTRLRLLAFGTFLAAVVPNQAEAAPGDLDLAFGSSGKVVTDFSGHADSGSGVALQSDGKIVVVGIARSGTDNATGDFAVARYNPDGTLDVTFGNGGKVTTDFEGNLDIASDVAIQADGKIIAAGRSQNSEGIDFALARYNSDGSLDTSFGSNHDGKIRTIFPGLTSRLVSVAIQNDQKIVAAGDAYLTLSSDDFALARYNTDGTLDPSFGSNGIVITDFAGANASFIRALVIQPNQKIVVAGTASVPDQNFALARYNSDGSLDTTFGPNGTGKVTTDFAGSIEFAYALTLQADGAIVAAGFSSPTSDMHFVFSLARYTPDGIVDPSFGSAGMVTTDFSGHEAAPSAVVVQSDGSIVAGGYDTTPSGETDFALARYRPDGTLDSSFGVGGEVTTDFGSYDGISAMVLQPDGQLVAAGYGDANGDFALARYLTGLASARPLNISTRAQIGSGDSVLIGGFIVTGSDPKKVILRAIGPSLSLDGTTVLADPTLELHGADDTVITNDNWRESQEEEINATGLAPANDLESAIVATLEPGAYTAIVSGQGGGTGVGLVEAYDLLATSDSQLANISTRGMVGTDANVMIGGFILGGPTGDTTVVVRGIGPSLGEQVVANALADPTVDLYDSQGAVLASNDNWQDTQKVELEASGLAPNDENEAAILMHLSPGAYTAILRGKDNTSGVGLVEAYNLP